MQLSGQGGRCRVIFPPITISDIWVFGCFGDCMSLLFLLLLTFVLPVVVLALTFSGVAFTFAFPSAALSIPSLPLVGTVAGVESFPAAAGRIRR